MPEEDGSKSTKDQILVNVDNDRKEADSVGEDTGTEQFGALESPLGSRRAFWGYLTLYLSVRCSP